MKFDKIEKLDDERFRRLTGVKRTTFDKMVQILQEADKAKKIKGGRKYKLSLEDMLLMALEYMREYKTYFHISQSYGVSESSAYKAVKWIEDTLIKHPEETDKIIAGYFTMRDFMSSTYQGNIIRI
ncbi:putative transposase for insertion sequence element IS702 [Neochlamydia sp. TUME1]|nr:putative transposase for insertion sequence element IS702 [Neochlamydia sp. TUME1]